MSDDDAASTIACSQCGSTVSYNKARGDFRCLRCQEARSIRVTGRSPEPPIKPSPGAQPSSTDPSKEVGPERSLADLEKAFGQAASDAQEILLTRCEGCGAQVEVPRSTNLVECLFCDRKTQVGEAVLSTASKDAIVVPFGVTPPQAIALMRDHMAKLWLRPGKVAQAIATDHVRQVYVPFWAYDVDVSTSWEASRQEYREPGCLAKLFGKKGTYVSVPFFGQHQHRSDDWLTCASIGIGAPLVRELRPFSTSGREPGAALPSEVPAERCAIGPLTAWSQAQQDLRRHEFQKVHQTLSQDHERPVQKLQGAVRLGTPMGKAAWLPLYILSVRTQRGLAQVIVNGETGKVASCVPFSLAKAVPAGLAASLIAVGLVVVTAGTVVPVTLVALAWHWLTQRALASAAEASFMSEN